MNRNLLVSAIAAMGAITMASAWAHSPGRMNGGGSFFCYDSLTSSTHRVTHGFQLNCKLEGEPVREPNNLEINFSGGDNFHLTTLQGAICGDLLPPGGEQPPTAGFDTFDGTGIGTFNGLPANIRFTFYDGGEPELDSGQMLITTISDDVRRLACSWTGLDTGNHQALQAIPR